MNTAVELIKQGNRKLYKKTGDILARRNDVEKGLIISTLGGKIETIHVLSKGDYIVKNIAAGTYGEEYAMSEQDLAKRYRIKNEGVYYDGTDWSIYEPVGFLEAIEYWGEPFTFTAAWGEDMLCEAGDMIGHSPDDTEFKDVYRIKKDVFAATYELISC